MHPATTPLPITTALGRSPTPSTSTTTFCPEKISGRNAGNGVQAYSSPTHMGKASCSPLGATNRDGNPRQTGSTTADSHCDLPIHTQQSRPPSPPHQTVQHTVLQQCCRHSIPSTFKTQSVLVLTTPAYFFFLRKKIPASHRGRGETPTISLSLGPNREGKERVKGEPSRIHSSRIGSVLVCVRWNLQHRVLKLPNSIRFPLITTVMIGVPTSGPIGCLVSPLRHSFQTL